MNNAAPNVGEMVEFIVALRNLGPEIATGVEVQDLLPAGLAFVAALPSRGTWASDTGTWSVGSLAPEEAETLQILVTVTSPSAQVNSVAVTHSDELDRTDRYARARAEALPGHGHRAGHRRQHL